MIYHFAIVHKDPGSAYGVTFPGLPGCFSAADTQDEIVPNAVEALALWLEGEGERVPIGLDEVRATHADDLAAGAFIVSVPLIRNSGKMVRANISMDGGALAAIDAAAEERGLTRSAFLAQAARNEMAGGVVK
ncbi:CopG family transcriptional regulator [Erythrobacter sp. SG61-1L]|uniref:type II toxin-antitoxin system HicB family antitoxin n=1 Tax=Erythrobacter sp. SG61-1L TaxID=1603897 RepID=UPI0006C92405|nr:type II toxin-antitoxin system HicB family antitoxin [Erythrobacter sp. SG61-1L]KPL67394.1 CopG family transcriptional regulator [Erythrobacter sp. SG61-1L]